MLLKLDQLLTKYNLQIRGVCQVGAHWGEEVPIFRQYNINPIILIEPCAPAFAILEEKYSTSQDITLFNVACASYTGEASMFVETANGGQSNSLLKPANHMRQYPEIKFRDTELVQVRPLDALLIPSSVNMLSLDVQGTEGHVLRGAALTLKQIDYVYTEVNADNANLYEGATPISEMDAILHEFKRVETSWVGNHGWGDACYIRKTLL
jgi:FkbM family methyltransferase